MNDINSIYKKIIHLKKVDSTNKYAKSLVNKEINFPVLIYSDKQTEGRGRLGRTFVSNAGVGIYMTILFKSNLNILDITKVTGYTSVIVSNVIDKLIGINTSIKWVNDIYVNNKKLCGILTESIIKKNEVYLIVGIGLNVLRQEFPDELKEIVTTLEDETNKEFNKEELINEIAYSFFNEMNKLTTKEYIATYRNKSNVIGKNVELKIGDNYIYGKAIDIDEDGELVVESGENTIKIYSGEITKVKVSYE